MSNWNKIQPKSPIMRKWLKESELPKNYIAFTKKAMKKWNFDKKFHNWPHEYQMAFVILINVYGVEAVNKIPDTETARRIGKFFLQNKNLVFWTKNMSDKKKKFFYGSIYNDIETLKAILPMSEKTISNAKNRRSLRFISENSNIAVAASNYKKEKAYSLEKEKFLWARHKKFRGYRISGVYENIVYEICETPEILFLDDASDCCQGFNKTGESCMVHGITNRNEGFLVFRDKKNKLIFAQAWVRSVGHGILLYDSVEFKGSFRESFALAVYKSIMHFKKRYSYVAVGASPNRTELNKFLFSKRNSHLSRKKENEIREHISKYVNQKEAYTDAKRVFIF